VSNGVDPALFHPLDKARCRVELGLPADRKIVVSVGHMIERKGFHVLIEAISLMPPLRRPVLVLIGGRGEETDYRPHLDAFVEKLGVRGDVLFTGGLLNTELCPWYNAADISALASSREGWANVLLESLACGRPVVATDVWGTRECLCHPEYGILVGERSGPAFARALDEALWERGWDAETLTAYAHENTWDRVGERHLAELARAVADYPRGTRGLAGRALSLITAGGRSS
jgi:glycosyltransferase involved in cell wall biosynthesis